MPYFATFETFDLFFILLFRGKVLIFFMFLMFGFPIKRFFFEFWIFFIRLSLYDIPLPPSVRREKMYKTKKRKQNKKYSKFNEEPFYRKPKHKKHKNIKTFPLKRRMKNKSNVSNVAK